MAHSNQAKKRVRQNEKRRLHNKYFKTIFRRIYKKALELTKTGNKEESKKTIQELYRWLDKAVSKGVIHWKTAARKKSRIMKRFNSIIV